MANGQYFCAHCGHRVYQHGHAGCEHVELAQPDIRKVLAALRDAGPPPPPDTNEPPLNLERRQDRDDWSGQLLDAWKAAEEKRPCDCTHHFTGQRG
jgi:hypothetical protein